MPTEVVMPKLGLPMTAGTVVRWLVADGQPVQAGRPTVSCTSARAEEQVPEGEYVVALGRAEIARPGKDASVVAIGQMRGFALPAAEELAKGGLNVEVVDPQSIVPLDEDAILTSVKKTDRLVVVDEDNPFGSVASGIVGLAAREAFGHLDAAPKTVTAPPTPVPFSPPLEDEYIPSPAKIGAAVKAVVS